MANTLVDGSRLLQTIQQTKAYIDKKTAAGGGGMNAVALTAQQYAALATKDRLTMYVVGPQTKTMAIYCGKALLWEKTLAKFEGKFLSTATTSQRGYNSNSTSGTSVLLGTHADADGEFEVSSISVTPFFMNFDKIERIDNIGNYGGVTNLFGMFANCVNLASANLANLDTSKVTGMGSVFANCRALSSLDLSAWNTSSLKTMDSTFTGCWNLKSLNLSGWNTSSVTWLDNLCSACTSLNYINLRGWNFSAVTSATDMFKGCTSLTIVGGPVSGIKVDLDLSACPLTAASAMVFINGLAVVTANSRTLKLKSSTYSSLTSAQRTVALNKGWMLTSA